MACCPYLVEHFDRTSELHFLIAELLKSAVTQGAGQWSNNRGKIQRYTQTKPRAVVSENIKLIDFKSAYITGYRNVTQQNYIQANKMLVVVSNPNAVI